MGTAITIVILILAMVNLLAFLSPKFRRENSLHERAKRLGWKPPKSKNAAPVPMMNDEGEVEWATVMVEKHEKGYLYLSIEKDGKEIFRYEEDKG